ncbi:uncharacterized protein [Periplaneta americana]|uniref:uncharacterized protein isoform X4 n=1 Tax=Periplaneta americana TaxID=6978 RepID=UPI0037E86108
MHSVSESGCRQSLVSVDSASRLRFQACGGGRARPGRAARRVRRAARERRGAGAAGPARSGPELAPRRVLRHPAPGGRHAAGGAVPQHPAAPAARGPARAGERRGVGRRRDAGAPRHAAGVAPGRQPPAALAQPAGQALLPLPRAQAVAQRRPAPAAASSAAPAAARRRAGTAAAPSPASAARRPRRPDGRASRAAAPAEPAGGVARPQPGAPGGRGAPAAAAGDADAARQDEDDQLEQDPAAEGDGAPQRVGAGGAQPRALAHGGPGLGRDGGALLPAGAPRAGRPGVAAPGARRPGRRQAPQGVVGDRAAGRQAQPEREHLPEAVPQPQRGHRAAGARRRARRGGRREAARPAEAAARAGRAGHAARLRRRPRAPGQRRALPAAAGGRAQLQAARGEHAAARGVRGQHGLPGAQHQRHDRGGRGPHDQRAAARGALHGAGRRQLPQLRWLRRQRRRGEAELAAEADGHPRQQAGHEPHPLRGPASGAAAQGAAALPRRDVRAGGRHQVSTLTVTCRSEGGAAAWLCACCRTTVEQLHNEINALDSRIQKVRKQIDLPSTEDEIKMQMGEFLQMAEREVSGLQRDMQELESVRKALSEFFCEDTATFKLEECFRVFHGFCVKFRQAVAENERRRVQEEQANARRRQREEQLASRRRQQSCESDSNLVDSLLCDIRSGFAQSQDLRARKPHNGGCVTSEEEVSSLTGSPLVARRRMGSFSGPTGEPGGREEGYSPGDRGRQLCHRSCLVRADVTPNGSLRRRRSRVPSEEDDSNLMDFLRSSGHDGSRERKSWGSLDRSWARRARGGGRKRPDLLTADFSGERERPSSPSPLLPSAPEGDNKPKAWRQKIEAWLQENEKEEKQTEELRRRSRRVQSNRRSLEADSENEGRSSTLDTLPEEKATNTQYKRVYSDWRPTIEKTDVVGAMEAIEEAQPQTPVKDKSPWRKSNLNVPNSAEETELDMRRLRRIRSRGSMDTAPNPLQSIKEECKRKGIIGALGAAEQQDCLTLYLRRPSDAPAPPAEHQQAAEVPGDMRRSLVGEEPPPTVPRRLRRTPHDDQADIDADNVETPPATRRRATLLQEEETLGDGQFDRFSSARRTRRYKKTSDYSSDRDAEVVSPELVSEKQVVRPATLHVASVCAAETPAPATAEDTAARLRKWQDRLKYRGGAATPGEDAVAAEALANIATTRRELQTLDQPRPRERVRLVEHVPEIRVHASAPKAHDLHDEGFEETQSLASETGTSSDVVDSPRRRPHASAAPARVARADSSGSSSSNPAPHPAPARALGRSASVRGEARASVIPRRTASLRKTDSQASLARVASGSRTSLRSSRSSLNSAASVNTVKHAPRTPPARALAKEPARRPAAPAAAAPAKKPLGPAQLKAVATPASRSSSSGSSIGPTARRPRPAPGVSTSFKENAASRSSSSGSSVGPARRGFMRPTAASAAKDSVALDATKTRRLAKPN